MNRLVVRYQYTSRCENFHCVAIVAHKWLLVIGSCLRIQILYTHYQCRFNIHPIVKIVIRTIVSRLWRMGGFFGSVILLVVVQMDGMSNG